MITIGSQVYIVPDDARHAPYYAKVESIGKKYIHVEGNISKSRFRISDHRSADYNDWNPRLTFYESKRDYEIEQQFLIESKELIDEIVKKLPEAELEKLKEIYLML